MSAENDQMEIDSSNNVNNNEDEELKEEEEAIKNIAVDLLIMVKSAQNQNGLRHNDYGRYHKYCQRKLHRMRKSLKFT
jgi:signal recognition particle subunit SRP68